MAPDTAGKKLESSETLDYEFDDSETEDTESHSALNEEAGYICNTCGEEIVVPLDFSQGRRQEYVEDCPVCCNPNVIFVHFDSDGQPNISSRAEQDPQ